MVYPLLYSIILAFFRWNGIGRAVFVGLENLSLILRDPVFWLSLRNTIQFAVVVTLATVGLGFLLAVIISRGVWGHRLYRIGYFVPYMIAVVVVATLWVQLFEYNWGLINTVFRVFGLEYLAIPWLAERRYSLLSITLVAIWKNVGFPMIMLLGSVEQIPGHLHDAATIDGVNEWQRLWYLIVPLSRPVLAALTVMQLIFSMKVFDLVYVMTRGGPAHSSEVLVSYLYYSGFMQYRFGYASGNALFMFLIIFTLTYVYLRWIRIEAYEF